MASEPSHSPNFIPGATVSERDADAFEDRCIERLKAQGFRITMPRVQVIRALATSTEPLTAYAIHERIIQAKGKIDVVSVYRILEALTGIGLVHHISHLGVVDGYLACRRECEHLSESQHLYCTSTRTVQETPVPPEALAAIQEQLKKLHFEASCIKIEIIGDWKKS